MSKEGDARVALALSARHYSGMLTRLLGSLRGLLHEQLFLDEAPLVYPAGSASVRVQNLLDFCTLPGLLSLNGDVACSTPAGAGAMFPIASQADDADMVLPRLSLYFRPGGVVVVGNGADGRLELWADESSGHSGTVTREPGLHRRAAFSATGLSVGDYDSHANFSDARAPRAAIVHLGLAANTLLATVTIQATASANRSAWPVQLGRVGQATPTTTLDVIDFGGSTTSERTVSQLSQAGAITLSMPLGLWYGQSNHPVAGIASARGLQISALQVQSIANLDCWACADSTAEGTTCPAPADTPRYACP